MELTNKQNLNEAIVRAIKRDWYSGSNEKRDYSVTQLLNPPKIFHLINRHRDQIVEDVGDKMFMLMGSAMHSILERANDSDAEFLIIERARKFFNWIHENPNIEKSQLETMFISQLIGEDSSLGDLLQSISQDRFLVEKRFKYTTKGGHGKIISGGIDLYDRETRTLHDYKFTSIWTWIYRNRPDSRKEEWIEQTNMYRLFLEKQGFEVDKIYINLLFRDYSKSAAKYEQDYPRQIETMELPLLGLDVVERLIENKVAEIEKYRVTRDDDIPPCTSQERWQQQDTYAVYKTGNKKASKVEYSYAGAKSWMETEIAKLAEKDIAKGMDTTQAMQRAADIFRIEKRDGVPSRCESYCSVRNFCNFWREYEKKLVNK